MKEVGEEVDGAEVGVSRLDGGGGSHPSPRLSHLCNRNITCVAVAVTQKLSYYCTDYKDTWFGRVCLWGEFSESTSQSVVY